MENKSNRLVTVIAFVAVIIASVAGTMLYLNSKNCPTKGGAANQEAIKAGVEEYLKENPIAVYTALTAATAQIQQQQQDAEKALVRDLAADIEAGSPILGNKDAKNVIVKFSDYNCGYCRKAGGTINEILQSRDDVKVIVKDWAILGEASRLASLVALGVSDNSPEKYADFHFELLKKPARSLENVAAAGTKVGLDADTLKGYVTNPKYIKQLQANDDIARKIGLTGTPALIVNGELFKGAVGRAVIEKNLN